MIIGTQIYMVYDSKVGPMMVTLVAAKCTSNGWITWQYHPSVHCKGISQTLVPSPCRGMPKSCFLNPLMAIADAIAISNWRGRDEDVLKILEMFWQWACQRQLEATCPEKWSVATPRSFSAAK